MTAGTTQIGVRSISPSISAIEIHGDVTSASEGVLMDAYAGIPPARTIVLDFTGLDYMNSGGIGLLVTLLVRCQRHGQRLTAIGINDHYREILSLTRLDEAIAIYPTEAELVAATAP
jgi:anti-sigma B factor antagonist